MLTLPPLSLYIHIPWCIKKCPYCDFNSHKALGNVPEKEYIDALIADMYADLPFAQGRRLSTIFFGGGTPSLFSASSIDTILQSAEDIFGFLDDIEITLEANPGAIDEKKFAGYFNAGVNRLSIGVQSFNSAHLQRLGRIHTSKNALNAINSAQKAGFDNINIDLMHGLPDQTIKEAESDIEIAMDSGVPHVSWYQLTIEPNTEFFSRPPVLPADERLADIQQAGMFFLRDHGFQQYEVSAFYKNHRPSQHNINYWTFGDSLGIGAGAHGKITLTDSNQIIRTAKTRQPDHYLARVGAALVKQEPIESGEIALEFMMNALRLKQGVPTHYFNQRTGLETETIEKIISQLQSEGLMEPSSSHFCTTNLGYRFLNSVLQYF